MFLINHPKRHTLSHSTQLWYVSRMFRLFILSACSVVPSAEHAAEDAGAEHEERVRAAARCRRPRSPRLAVTQQTHRHTGQLLQRCTAARLPAQETPRLDRGGRQATPTPGGPQGRQTTQMIGRPRSASPRSHWPSQSHAVCSHY